MQNIKPGDTITKIVYVVDTGTLDAVYNLVWQESNNEITNEILVEGIFANHDTSSNLTRQLDYYDEKGVTTNSYSTSIKKLESTAKTWLLRSAKYDYFSYLLVSDTDKASFSNNLMMILGVSPAFRIG